MPKPYLDCHEVTTALNLGSVCCDSCHEDQDFGYPMIEQTIERDQIEVLLVICCGVSIALDRRMGSF